MNLTKEEIEEWRNLNMKATFGILDKTESKRLIELHLIINEDLVRKKWLDKAKKDYAKGVFFISPFFPDAVFKSTGDIAGYSFAKTTHPYFINMWVDEGLQPQGNVPVLLGDVWAEIVPMRDVIIADDLSNLKPISDEERENNEKSEEEKRNQKAKDREDYLWRINEHASDYFFFSGQLNWRNIIP